LVTLATAPTPPGKLFKPLAKLDDVEDINPVAVVDAAALKLLNPFVNVGLLANAVAADPVDLASVDNDPKFDATPAPATEVYDLLA